ncbi:MAG: hypothetical protein U0232_07635 [Thermomicrobiales bacterium]
MSRIGLKPIPVPGTVQVDIADGNVVTVKGPKGQLQRQLPAEMILGAKARPCWSSARAMSAIIARCTA